MATPKFYRLYLEKTTIKNFNGPVSSYNTDNLLTWPGLNKIDTLPNNALFYSADFDNLRDPEVNMLEIKEMDIIDSEFWGSDPTNGVI